MIELEETEVTIYDPATKDELNLKIGDIIWQLERQGIMAFVYPAGLASFSFASEDKSILKTADEVWSQFQDAGIDVRSKIRSGN